MPRLLDLFPARIAPIPRRFLTPCHPAPPAVDAAAAEPAGAPAVEVPAVPLTRKVIKGFWKTDCKVTEFVEGYVADAVMTEYRLQEATMGAQVS